MSARDIIDIDIPSENEAKEGYFTNMSNREYHEIDGISSTLLEDLELSVAIYDNRKYFKHHRFVYDIGNCIHDALAYPNEYKDMYIECETAGLNTLQAEKQRGVNPDKTVIHKGGLAEIEEIVLKTKLIYGSYINIGAKECAFIFRDEDTGLIFKIKPDLHLLRQGIIIDYKSTKETTHCGFEETIERYKYHRSAAFYIDGVNKAIDKFKLPFKKVNQFGWICIPKTAPYKPYGFLASAELIEKGREDYQRLINKLLEVRETKKDSLFKEAHSREYRRAERENN